MLSLNLIAYFSFIKMNIVCFSNTLLKFVLVEVTNSLLLKQTVKSNSKLIIIF